MSTNLQIHAPDGGWGTAYGICGALFAFWLDGWCCLSAMGQSAAPENPAFVSPVEKVAPWKQGVPWKPLGAASESRPPDDALSAAQPVDARWRGDALSAATPYRPAELVPQGASSGAVDLLGMAPPETTPIQMAALATNAIPRGEQFDRASEPRLPPGTRAGFFQKVNFSGTWLPALSSEPDALGLGELDASVVFGFPLLRRDTPLLITPRFEVGFLENADALDLPTELYGASTEFRHLRKFGDGPWAMDVAVAVGYYSDFEADSEDAIRTSGRALAVYERNRGTKWILGVVYLNRAGASVLPAVGVIHEPTSDLRWELIFPRPRVAWRLEGSVPSDERWFSFGAEFGGGIWSIARPSTGETDQLSYRDFRLVAGYERKVLGGLTRRFECGYVFGRELEFESDTPDVSLDDSLFLRAGFSY